MGDNGFIGSVAALRRKLRALAAVARDEGATAAERSNAASLKRRIEQRLRQTGSPAGDWTDMAFRLGRRARDAQKSAGAAAAETNWTENARQLGKAVRRGYKKFLSE